MSPVRGCQVTCGGGWGGGEIINMGSPGSDTAVVNRQQSTQHPPHQDADSQDDQTSLQPNQEQAEAPPKQEAGHRHQADHHRGGAGQHRQRGPGGRPPLQIGFRFQKIFRSCIQKVMQSPVPDGK